MTMAETTTATCICGSIKITTTQLPHATAICHCTDCRKFTGAIGAFYVSVPRDRATITGSPSAYTKKADSGRWITRSWCGNCGSNLFDVAEKHPGLLFLHGGILPVGSIPEPNMEMYVRGCERWEARYPHCIVFGGDVFEGETFEGETAT
ncbi:uncharacterized protein EHS24_005054 [Apiotrichum porosum]|uniref:CENP-V/GFA domain-containing protein n=1 Tax=Apiotrichum porosum TaxID=105984 RepID=A0A427Y6T7_9TREE|nr:uncharacterized protein EHS24_005054 [Apiotrichum porosum]RSH86782.1 hypothetical protein EHS24_005054 [Apiotrichum porosum]